MIEYTCSATSAVQYIQLKSYNKRNGAVSAAPFLAWKGKKENYFVFFIREKTIFTFAV